MAEKTIGEMLGEALSKIAPKVKEGVIHALVERDVKKRETAIVQCWDKCEELKRDLRRIKPDVRLTGNDAEKTRMEFFSDKLTKEKEELEQKIAKYEKAIVAAVDKGDMKDVYDLNNKGGGGKKSEGETDSSSD